MLGGVLLTAPCGVLREISISQTAVVSSTENMKLAALFSTVSASNGFIKLDGILYEIHEKSGALANFWDNKEYCDGLGGGWKVPTPTNAGENQVAHQMLEHFYGGTFIGISKERDYENIRTRRFKT